jgi:hypothetical protein
MSDSANTDLRDDFSDTFQTRALVGIDSDSGDREGLDAISQRIHERDSRPSACQTRNAA